jgi:predicted DNA-binding transcriptional regulator AlpA
MYGEHHVYTAGAASFTWDPTMSLNESRPHDAASLHPGDLVDEKEAAAILGTAVQTLRNWRWQGEGPRVRKIGARLVRYHRADLLAFISGEDPA